MQLASFSDNPRKLVPSLIMANIQETGGFETPKAPHGDVSRIDAANSIGSVCEFIVVFPLQPRFVFFVPSVQSRHAFRSQRNLSPVSRVKDKPRYFR